MFHYRTKYTTGCKLIVH